MVRFWLLRGRPESGDTVPMRPAAHLMTGSTIVVQVGWQRIGQAYRLVLILAMCYNDCVHDQVARVRAPLGIWMIERTSPAASSNPGQKTFRGRVS